MKKIVQKLNVHQATYCEQIFKKAESNIRKKEIENLITFSY